jgi:hypothetical protein
MIGQSTAEGRHGFLNLAVHTVVDGVLILSLLFGSDDEGAKESVQIHIGFQTKSQRLLGRVCQRMM